MFAYFILFASLLIPKLASIILLLLQGTTVGGTTAAATTEEGTTAVPTTDSGMYTFIMRHSNTWVFTENIWLHFP